VGAGAPSEEGSGADVSEDLWWFESWSAAQRTLIPEMSWWGFTTIACNTIVKLGLQSADGWMQIHG
jgi:hypothetical protein